MVAPNRYYLHITPLGLQQLGHYELFPLGRLPLLLVELLDLFEVGHPLLDPGLESGVRVPVKVEAVVGLCADSEGIFQL